MSAREELSERICRWLQERSDTFNAPYGVLQGLYTPKSGRGRARVITFGICRTLDACLTIWSTERLDLHTNRGDHAFASEEEFYAHCVAEHGVER
jgi:hypothetical protein